MKFFIEGFFSKCDQIRSVLWILSHLLKKYLMENLIFCAAWFPSLSRVFNLQNVGNAFIISLI